MRKNVSKLSCLVLFSLLAPYLRGQSSSPGAFVIADDRHAPVSGATVILSSGKHTLTTTVSDSAGRVTLPATTDTTLSLRISHIGFFIFEAPANLRRIAPSDTIFLKPDAVRMSTVTVESQRPLVVVQPDRYVLTIDGKVNFGNTAADVLKKAPGITIVNDVVYLEGKPVMLQVSGKNLPVTGRDLLAYLSSSSSATIDQIELITTPPASMDAAFGGGVINLRLRKPKDNGVKGTVTLAAGGRSTYPFSRINGSLNYRQGKFNMYANAGLYEGRQVNETYTRRIFSGTQPADIREQSAGDTRSKSIYYTAGVDYYIDRHNIAGFLWTGNAENVRNHVFTSSSIYHGPGLDSVNQFDFVSPRTGSMNVVNLNYKHIFDSLGQEISVDIDRDFLHSVNEGYQTYRYFMPDKTEYKTPLYVNQDTRSAPQLYGIKADYRRKLHNTQLEAGLKYARTKINYRFLQQSDQASPALHGTLNDRFDYDEKIAAAYVSFSGKQKNYSYRIGLRTEYTDFDASSRSVGKEFSNRYLSLFPSLSLARPINKNNTVNFSFRRSIVRPRFSQLNPFPYYLSPFYYYTGNPFLQPYFPYSVRLGHSYRNKINSYLAYTYATNRITEITLADPSALLSYSTRQNNGTNSALFAGTSYISDLAKWWYTNNGVNLVYGKFRFTPDGHKEVELISRSLGVYSTQRFTLPHKIVIEAYAYFNSPTYYDVTYTKSYWFLNLSLAKPVFKGLGELSVNVDDVFYSNITRTRTRYDGIDFTMRNRWDSRIYSIKLFWRFGNRNVKDNRQRDASATNEERNRT